MSFSKKFDFPLPSHEELEAVRMLARDYPKELDGRDMWVLQNFLGDSQ